MNNVTSLVGPRVILKKHEQMNPTLTLIVSAVKGEILVDISAPGTIGELLLMIKVLQHQVDKMIFKAEVPTSAN